MTNGTTKSSEVKSKGDCEYCPDSKDVDLVNGMCMTCMAKSLIAGTPLPTVKTDKIEVTPSTSPINERLKKAYLDQYNETVVSGMSHEDIKYKIADMEDLVKVLQAQTQALMDIDDEWTEKLEKSDREALREKDKQYRAKARPRVNSDGTLKVSKPTATKPKQDIAPGNAAFENLVKKMMLVPNAKTGLTPTREQVVELLNSMGRKG